MDSKKLSYNPITGEFRRAGKRAGCVDESTGYRRINMNGRFYYEHRLAVLFSGYKIPRGMRIDHINGDRADNRLSNLRVITPSQNSHHKLTLNKNNTSGITGVRFDSSRGKFFAYITVNYKMKSLGRFETFEAAVRTRNAAHQRVGT